MEFPDSFLAFEYQSVLLFVCTVYGTDAAYMDQF